VGEQHRHGGFHDDVPRRAAEDHLAQPAFRVGALDEEVGARLLRVGEGAAAWAAALPKVFGAATGSPAPNLLRNVGVKAQIEKLDARTDC
jgi:hypothetical protein